MPNHGLRLAEAQLTGENSSEILDILKSMTILQLSFIGSQIKSRVLSSESNQVDTMLSPGSTEGTLCHEVR